MKKEEKPIYQLFAIFATLAVTPYNTFMESNEKVMGHIFVLTSEINELLEQGYSKEEIQDLIINCNYKQKDESLTDEECKYLKNEALKILDIRYRIYLENKDNELNRTLD